MAEDTAEVKIKLVADEAAKKVTEDLKEGLKEAHKGTLDVSKGMLLAQGATEALGGAASALAGPYGVALEAVNMLKEALTGAWEMAEKLGESSLEAANNAHKEMMGLAGTFQLFDAGKHNFEDIRNYAEGMHEELEQIGIKGGIAGSQVTAMYNSIIDRGGVSSEKAKQLTEDMTVVGKVVRGGADSLAQGFSMMEMGVVRAKNPLVQLISVTGTLKGNAHAVAQQMQHMTPTKQMELAQKAIEKQAELMKKAGVMSQFENLDTLKTSFEGIRESFLKTLGTPMLEKLIPHLIELRDFLVANADKIENFAASMGEKLGEMIDWFADAFGGIYESVHQNWDDIVSTTKDLLGPLMLMWDYIHEHQSAIGRFFKDVTDDVVGAYKWIDKAMKTVGEELLKIIKELPVVGKKVAAMQAEGIEGHAKISARGLGGEDVEHMNKQIEAYRKVAAEAGKSNEEIERTVANIMGWHNAAVEQAADAENQLGAGHTQAFYDYMNRAIRAENDGALEHGISLLKNSELAKQALVQGSVTVEGGFDHFISVIREKSPELAKQLREMSNTIKKEGGIKGLGPMINFNNNTFNIHQDFKDDPDRVMIAFRQDILKSAVSRRQSKLGTIFGL